MQESTTPPPTRAATSTGRNPIRSPMTPAERRDQATDERRGAHHERDRRREAGPGARRGPRRGRGMYGRRHLDGQERHAEDEEDASDVGSAEHAADRAEGQVDDPTARHDLGSDLLDPNATSSAVADRQRRRQPEDRRQRPAEAVDRAGRPGPDRPRTRPAPRPRTARSSCPVADRGVTSRMPASITPVLPSWNPMSSMLRASCHGSRDRATPANTTASTRALRTITALRLYLSAHTPHNGTSGMPTTKISAREDARRTRAARPRARPSRAGTTGRGRRSG